MRADELVGVWRLESMLRDGRTIPGGGLTYLVARRTFFFEVTPALSAGPSTPPLKLYAAQEAADGTLRLEIANAKLGPQHVQVTSGGDSLEWSWARADGSFPVAGDSRGTIERYARETSPRAIQLASDAGPWDAPARLSHPVLGGMKHDARRNVWTRGSLAIGGERMRVEVDGAHDATKNVFDRAVEVAREVPLEELARAAFDELTWLDSRTGGGVAPEGMREEAEGRLSPTSIRVKADGGVFVTFAEGLEVETDASFEIEDSSYTGPDAGAPEEAANDGDDDRE